ncbi:MAG TPA: hypothetical protein VF167_13745 [Longimicrobiaceae bacterium]
MIRTSLRLFALVGTLVVSLSACADGGSPLEVRSALDVRVGGPYLSLSPVQHTVRVLERSVPLSEDLVVSKVIGSSGGVIELPAAGLRLTVPANALQRPTEISVRAHAGTLVAYSFEPHGTHFARVVTAEQSLAGTVAEGTSVRASARGYFSDPESVDWDSNRAAVSEVSLVREAGEAVEFYLNHFSGYLIAID